MEFRRTGHRDERRRRVLIDELITSPGTSSTEPAVERGTDGDPATRRYSAAVLDQPAVTCLIPTRGWTLSVLFLGGLATLGGLLSLHAAVYPQLTAHRGALVALDLTARGSLASWFGASLLLIGALVSAMVYWLRSHKMDDYRGHYRLWLATSILAVLASADLVAGLHQVIGELLEEMFRGRLGGDSRSWATASLALAFVVWGGRVALEIRSSRSALFFLLLAAASFTCCLSLAWGWLRIATPLVAELLFAVGWLGGIGLLLFAVLTYCRFVLRDTQGLVSWKVPEGRSQRRRWFARRRSESVEKPDDEDAETAGGADQDDDSAAVGAKPRRTRASSSSLKRKTPKKKATEGTKSGSRMLRKGPEGNLRVDEAHASETDEKAERKEASTSQAKSSTGEATKTVPVKASFSSSTAAKPTVTPATASSPRDKTSGSGVATTGSKTPPVTPSAGSAAVRPSAAVRSQPATGPSPSLGNGKVASVSKPLVPPQGEDDEDDDLDADGEAGKGMSKAERRRLRKQQRRGAREEVES